MISRALLPRIVLASLCLISSASAQIPPGYYDSVDSTNPATLRSSLHPVIDDHQRFPYTSSATDTWDILELAQQDPSASNRILDVYRNDSYTKVGGGNSLYNREHTWPKSFGFPNDGASNYPYTDCHVLFLCNGSYNSARSNKPYDTAIGGQEFVTSVNQGQGGGSGVYVGNSNWTTSNGLGAWETWVGRRGDVARALLYLDLRYEGGNHGVTGHAEPDLILTDNAALIGASNTGNNESVAYMGMLSVLLQWHLDDPVDTWERDRHEVVFSFQGNRNPFIDHPEWVDCLFNGNCPPPPSGPIPFCFGDGSGAACPCLNQGTAGHGCGNSAVPTGSLLFSFGTASLSNPDLVLMVGDSIPNSPGLFFSGVSTINGGLGVPFGDGLRCAGGQVRRIQVVIAGFLGEAVTSIPLTSVELLLPADVRYYQWWYRDTAPVPCGSAFNTSNALEVTWMP